MFKLFLMSALILPALTATATSVGDTQTFTYNGTQSTETAALKGEITHTEYREEQVDSTCYRDVLDHYENVCEQVPHTNCDDPVGAEVGMLAINSDTDETMDGQRPPPPGPRPPPSHNPPSRPPPEHNPPSRPPPEHNPPSRPPPPGPRPQPVPPPYPRPVPEPRCHTYYTTECHQEARYRSEAYSCTKTVQVPYEVKDADIVANVNVKFGQLPDGVKVNDVFTLTLNDKDVSLTTDGKTLAYFVQKTETDSQSGSLVQEDITFDVQMLTVADANAAVSSDISSLTGAPGVVSFVVGKVVAPMGIRTSLKIEHEHLFGDKTMIDRDLKSSEVVLTAISATQTRVDIQTAALGMPEPLGNGGKFRIAVGVRLDVPGSLANPSVLSGALLAKTIEAKVQ